MTVSLLEHLDRCPTSEHVVDLWAKQLESVGLRNVREGELLDSGFFARSGLIVAWKAMSHFSSRGVRIVGAHTDSPGLHLKPNMVRKSPLHGLLAIEVYGSPILTTWFDRDLGLAGTVHMRDGSRRLFRIGRPLARLAHLAIHLDREINERGHVVDRHRHLAPIWACEQGELRGLILREVEADQTEVSTISAQLFDLQTASTLGVAEEFLTSARLDNQVSCWAAMSALGDSEVTEPSMVVLFDHEEIGSSSVDGAAGPTVERILERLALAFGAERGSYLAGLERSSMLSVDNSHAVHPNHMDRHDPDNAPILGGGVAVKSNVNQRYATSGRSLGLVLEAAQQVGVNLQRFSSRNDVPCGSTIGPIAATRLGIDTVDIGVPQLSMHSVREICHKKDVADLQNLIRAYLSR